MYALAPMFKHISQDNMKKNTSANRNRNTTEQANIAALPKQIYAHAVRRRCHALRVR